MSAFKRLLNDQVESIRVVLDDFPECSILSEDNHYVVLRCPDHTMSTYLGCALAWIGISCEIRKGNQSSRQYIRAHLQPV